MENSQHNHLVTFDDERDADTQFEANNAKAGKHVVANGATFGE